MTTFVIDCPDPTCGWSQQRFDEGAALRALHTHQERQHGLEPLPEPATPVGQLGYPAFQEAYIAAVRALPVGREFVTADLRDHVPAPLDHHYWGRAQTHAAHMGLIEPVSAQKSTLATTKGSRLLRWVRVAEKRRSA